VPGIGWSLSGLHLRGAGHYRLAPRATEKGIVATAVEISDALWTARTRWFEAKSEGEAAEALRVLEKALIAQRR